MSSKKDTPPMDLDALLGSDPASEATPEPETVDPIAARKAALLAELEKPSPIAGKSEAELTPAEREIRDLEDKVARKKSADLDASEDTYESVETGTDSIVIHFVRDGFSFAGRVWYRGQECEFPLDGKAYQNTKDRNGKTWLSMRNDPNEQVARFGAHFFSEGPWNGPDIFDTTGLTDPADIAALQQAAARERARNRAVPITV